MFTLVQHPKSKFFILFFAIAVVVATTLFVISDEAFVRSSLFARSKRYYSGPPEERAASWMIDAYATKYCKEHNMELIHIGDFTEPFRNLPFGIWLRSYSNQTLDEGRRQTLVLVQDFLRQLQHDRRAQVWYDVRKKSPKYKAEPATIPLSAVGVKIAYWDKEVHRPQAPFLAEVRFYDNTFYYFVADSKTQALKPVAQESYEQALQQIQ